MIETQQRKLAEDRRLLRRTVQSSAMIVAMLVALLLPLGYGLIAYQYEAADAELKAQLSAKRVAGFIFQHPSLWEFNTERLGEIIGSHPSGVLDGVQQRIVKPGGKVVAIRGTTSGHFTAVQRAPIVVGDAVLAELEFEASIDPLLLRIAFCAFSAACLGLLAYFSFRSLPLYALDNALGTIELLQEHMADKNEELTAQNHRLIEQEEALQQRSKELASAQRLGKIGDWSYRLGDTELWWSPEIFRLLRYDPASFHTSRDAVLSTYLGDGARRVIESQSDVMRTGSAKSVDAKVRCGDGSVCDVVVSSQAMTNDEGHTTGFFGTIQDITDRKVAEEQLEKLAYYDPLTGLANRTLFQRELNDSLGRCGRAGTQAALLLLDLDRFKEVHDSLGHAAGDELLTKVTNLISRVVERGHFLCRLGGDEFAIIMPDYHDIAEVKKLAGAVIAAVGGSIQLDRGEANIGTSIGIALIPQHGSNVGDLQRNADLALYRAKEEGRGRFSFFETGMSEAVQHKIALARDLRHAVDENIGLTVHYQPQVDLVTDRVTGFEALMRWTHPTFGTVPPSEFIPIAESSQLICDLGLWITRQATQQAKVWLDAGEPAREVAVNVSAAQIWNTDITADVARILDETGLPPHLLCLELTESLLADHTEARFRNVLVGLKELGVTLALDDFGTNYSSLGYLTQLPFDKLKIDRLFVDGITEAARARKLLEGIIALGRGLGMTIVAEGAEKLEEVEILRTFGCDMVQGYVFARPTLAADALAVAWRFETDRHGLPAASKAGLAATPALSAVA
ncbi:MAG: EAL domain-containing protein [Bradyrhizobium sp.]|nr:EAL domain-containing protein [Bradyrhizobium sp.]